MLGRVQCRDHEILTTTDTSFNFPTMPKIGGLFQPAVPGSVCETTDREISKQNDGTVEICSTRHCQQQQNLATAAAQSAKAVFQQPHD